MHGLRSFAVFAVLAASLVIAGCGTTLENARTVSQVGFLALNYEAMIDSFDALPLNAEERDTVDSGVAQLEEIRLDLKSLLDGDVNSEKVLDYATGVGLLTRISTAYNISRSGLASYYTRNSLEPPPVYLQFNRTAVSLHQALTNTLESERAVKGIEIVSLLRQSLSTYASK